MKWREEVGKVSFILFCFIHGILRYTIFSHRLSSSLGWMFVVHRAISRATSTLFTRASISYILISSHHHRHHRLMLSSAFTHFRVLFMAGCWLLVAVFHRISLSLVYHPCWLRWRMIRAAAAWWNEAKIESCCATSKFKTSTTNWEDNIIRHETRSYSYSSSHVVRCDAAETEMMKNHPQRSIEQRADVERWNCDYPTFGNDSSTGKIIVRYSLAWVHRLHSQLAYYRKRRTLDGEETRKRLKINEKRSLERI